VKAPACARRAQVEISEEEAAKLLNDERNLLKPGRNPEVIFHRPHNGSRNGGRAVPPIIREIVAVAAHHDTIHSVAESFGLSDSTVAQAKKGNVGVNRHDEDLKDRIDNHVKEKVNSIREQALDRLSTLFAHSITDKKLQDVKLREAVSIAKDLASVAERVQDRGKEGPRVVFVNQVRVKDESEYGEPIIVAHKEER
jgi:hypothetical protein